MKRKIKRFWLLYVMLLFLCGMTVYADAEKNEFPFAGERSITFTAEQSEISNYFNGGRAALDMYIRATKPEWLSYRTDTEKNCFSVSFSFAFESFDEYKERLEELCKGDVVILYSPDDVEYMENIEEINLMSLLEDEFAEDTLNVYQLGELFADVSGKMILNGQVYEYGNQLMINSERLPVKLDKLEICTQVSSQFSYDRTIRSRLNEANTEETVAAWKRQLQNAGGSVTEAEESEELVLEVCFQAYSIEELTEKTMRALAVPDFISWKEAFRDRKTTICNFMEKIDVSELYESENLEFLYEMTLPDSCGDILVEENDSISCSEYTVFNKTIGQAVSFSFPKPVTFSSVQVQTDLSNPMGRVKRRIQYRIPLSIASDYHEDIRENLEDTLVKGQILEIYDEISYRIYEIRYASWYVDQLEEMGNAQLEEEHFVWEKAYYPLGGSRFSDQWNGHQITFPQVTDHIVYELILPSLTFKQVNAETGETVDSVLELVCPGNEKISVIYRDASLRIWLVSGLCLLATGLAGVLVVLRIRRLKRHIVSKWRSKKFLTENKSFCYCSECGRKNSVAAKYCGGCGKRLDWQNSKRFFKGKF